MKGSQEEPPSPGELRPTLQLGDEASRELQELASRLQQALGDLFVVAKVLGTGGFATVFRVRDTVLKRDLAVKVLNPDLLASARTRERFQREAETVAKLSHPNVVQVHFIGRDADLLYIGMPCIEGGTLADRLARDGALPLADALRVLTEIVGAISHAHKKGIVHRDIKSQNILLDVDGDRCLVTDFGIARAEEASALTSTGLVIGTPAYLSPEQISGERGDHRVDIYAIGVLAYEIVAGRLPFEGTSTTAAMMKRFEGPPPPPSSVRADVPRFLDELIGKCLALDPADRFQSADDLLAAVRAGTFGQTEVVRTDGKRTVPPQRRSRASRAMPWIGVLGVAVVLLAIATRALWPGRGTEAKPAGDSSLALIAAGQYRIGSDSGSADARPAHVVELGAFSIGVREVTNGEYASVVSTAPPSVGAAPAAHPVTNIRWQEASNYCALRYANGRLPTEEEWEAAARGRAGRSTPWDNATTGIHANLAGAARSGPMPVGSYTNGATPEKVYDLLGNVWEWTSSRYRAYPGGSVRPTPAGTYYVIRGGAYDTQESVATPWYRAYANAIGSAEALSRTGFRCAVPGATGR